MYLKIMIIFLILEINILFIDTNKCGENEEPIRCGCEGTCENPIPKCLPTCIINFSKAPRCICKKGNVRNKINKCIEEN
ncbi:hypothetical protein Mgra_00009114, partial [Meloidogyne graminicola]